MALAVLPAFLVEIALYILPGFDGVRQELAALPENSLALLLTGAATVPYVLATVALGSFHAHIVACPGGARRGDRLLVRPAEAAARH